MDTTRSVATTTATPATGVVAARPQAETANDTSAFFANLLQKVTGQFFNVSSLVDPTALPTTIASQENRAPDPKPEASATTKDDKVDDANDKKNAAADDKASAAKDSANDAAKNDTTATPIVTDPSLTAQLSALQALLLTQQQTAAPVVQTAPVVAVQAAVAPEVLTPVNTTTTPVADPTTPVAAPVAAAPAATVETTVPTTPQELLAAQVQAAATVVQAPVVAKAAATATKVVASQPALLTNQPQTQDTTDTTNTPTTTAQSVAPQTAKAQSQSEAMSKLLGDTNAIRVTVTVDPQKTATATTDVYDHFSGYAMGENAGTSLANGQFGTGTATNALTADTAPTAPLPNVLTQASVAAQAPVVATPAPTTTTAPAARTDTVTATAVTSVTSSAASSDAQNGLGQMGLGQPGPGNTNATATAAATQQTSQPAATPAQVFEQIKVKITRATKAGLDEVTINLKPEDLGRVDIKLQVTPEGKVHATVTADKPDTLAMLQQDSQGLERALNDAGLRADAGNLQFNLRGDGNASTGSQFANGSGTQGNGATAGDDNASAPTYDYARAATQRGGVDTYA